MKANPLAIIVFILGLTSIFIALYAWRRRSTRGSQMFSLMMAAVAVYVIGYSGELASLDLPTMLTWSKIGYLGIFAFPTLFLMFVLQYSALEKWLAPRYVLLMFLVPCLLLAAKLTDDYFHLVYATTWLETGGPIPLLGFTRGPVYPLAIYSVIPGAIGVILLWRKRNHTPPLYRRQATLLASFAMLPLLVFLYYMSGIDLFPGLKYIDLNPFTSTLWGIGIGWAAFRYRLFELAPVARETLVETLNDGLFVLDSKARLVDANPMACQMMGWAQPPVGAAVDRSFSAWDDLREICLAAPVGETTRAEIMRPDPDKEAPAWFEATIHCLRSKSRRLIGRLIVVHDISVRKELERKLREASLVDDLTGLSNRRGFNILATQFVRMAKRMNSPAGFIFADMDGLKKINDTFGHAEGDQALVEMTNLLRATFRSSDVIARLGGDEFIVLMIETTENGTGPMLERLQSSLEAFNRKDGRGYRISASFGVSKYDPDHPRSLDELIAEADQAMYVQKQAKNKGGGG